MGGGAVDGAEGRWSGGGGGRGGSRLGGAARAGGWGVACVRSGTRHAWC